MDNSFKNSRFFNKQTITFLKAGLLFKKKTLFDSFEYEVSYESIDFKKNIKSTISNGMLFFAFCIFCAFYY